MGASLRMEVTCASAHPDSFDSILERNIGSWIKKREDGTYSFLYDDALRWFLARCFALDGSKIDGTGKCLEKFKHQVREFLHGIWVRLPTKSRSLLRVVNDDAPNPVPLNRYGVPIFSLTRVSSLHGAWIGWREKFSDDTPRKNFKNAKECLECLLAEIQKVLFHINTIVLAKPKAKADGDQDQLVDDVDGEADVAEHGIRRLREDRDDAEDDAESPEPKCVKLEVPEVAEAMEMEDVAGAAEAAMSTHEKVVKAGEDDGPLRHVIHPHDWGGLNNGWSLAPTVLENQEFGPEHKRLFFWKSNEQCLIPVWLQGVMEGDKMNSGYVRIFPLQEGVSLPADPVPVTDIYTALKDWHKNKNEDIKRYYKLPEFHKFVLASKKLLSRYLASAK